jgi:hypothetical protein
LLVFPVARVEACGRNNAVAWLCHVLTRVSTKEILRF